MLSQALPFLSAAQGIIAWDILAEVISLFLLYHRANYHQLRVCENRNQLKI